MCMKLLTPHTDIKHTHSAFSISFLEIIHEKTNNIRSKQTNKTWRRSTHDRGYLFRYAYVESILQIIMLQIHSISELK